MTAEDLLAGADAIHEVIVPPETLNPAKAATGTVKEVVVQIRPLTIGAFQLIMKAAKSDPSLIPILMIRESVVQPALNLEQIKRMHLGLIEFLVRHIREVSGLSEKKSP